MRHPAPDSCAVSGLCFRVRVALVVCAMAVVSKVAFAQITRVANTTLTLPQDPQTFGYSTEDAFAGITFDQPLAIVSPPRETDRVFVVEKTGRIQVVTNLNSTPLKQVFLDLSAQVLTSSEEGVLGLAFHPDFANNHYFYVFYSTTATTSAGTGAHAAWRLLRGGGQGRRRRRHLAVVVPITARRHPLLADRRHQADARRPGGARHLG